MSEIQLALKFIGKISKQGDGLIIWIPKEFRGDAKRMLGRQVRVEVTPAL